MQTAVQTVPSEPAPVCHCLKSFPPKLLTHNKPLQLYALLHVLGPHTHALFHSQGIFQWAKPSAGYNQCCCCCRYISTMHVPQSSFTLLRFRFVLFCISQSFDRIQVKWRRNGRLSWCEIYLFIMCHVYVLALSFSLWPLTSCYCSYDEKLIPVLTFFCPNKRHEAQATCPTC